MSWWAQSLMNSLRGGDDDDDDEDEEFNEEDDGAGKAIHGSEKSHLGSSSIAREGGEGEGEEEAEEEEGGTPTRGVKEDLSELTQTLTRQLWGVASFLAPSPPALRPDTAVDRSAAGQPDEGSALPGEVQSPRIAGIRNDFAEIGGRFRSGIESVLSHTKAVEISKIASTFLPFGSEEKDEGVGLDAVGVNEEVLTFARNVAMHPKTWLNFPLPDSEKDDDFEMSDAQVEHALALQHLAPEFAALRTELCPSQMSDGCFWKIYFVLLQSRLNRHDAELLSSPQILEARDMLLQDLHGQVSPGSERLVKEASFSKGDVTTIPIEENVSAPPSTFVSAALPTTPVSYGEPVADSLKDIVTEKHPIESSTSTEEEVETEKHPIQIITSDPGNNIEMEKQLTEMKVVDKSVIEEEPVSRSKSKDIKEDDGDEWLEDDAAEGSTTTTTSRGKTIHLEQEEDVSFSDLEMDDDEEERAPTTSSKPALVDSQIKSSIDWVQLNSGSGGLAKDNSSEPEAKETSDWLDIEDFDVE